jgi:hypothetical protein
MSMHLAHPAFSTTGKKRGKQKFASAEAKRKFEQQQESWNNLLKKHGIDKSTPKVQAKNTQGNLADTYKLTVPVGREMPKINSKDTGWVACTKGQDKVYTGTKVKGIGTMHKSNAVPIFSDEEAVAISTMRR